MPRTPPCRVRPTCTSLHTVDNYFEEGPCPVIFKINSSSQSQNCNSGRISHCWFSLPLSVDTPNYGKFVLPGLAGSHGDFFFDVQGPNFNTKN